MGKENTRGAWRALAGALLVGGVLGLAQGAQGQTTFTVTGPASITETDANQNLVFTVTRSGSALTAASTTVGWAITHDGTDGTNAADFGAVSGSVVFAAGEDAQQFLLTVIGDNDAEKDEGFTLQVSHGTHSVGAAYDGEIVGDDTHFTVTGPASMLENDGQASPDFTFTRTGAELPEQYIVTGDGGDVPLGAPRRGVYGTATLPRGGGTQTFAAGDDEKMGPPFSFQVGRTYDISVTFMNDGDKDYEWGISAVARGDGSLGNPENHTFAPRHRFTVLDNDIRLVVTAGPTSVDETDANAATSAYTITRLGGEFPSTTTVTWTVNHGTAASATASPTVAADFSAVTGTVDFAAGEDSQTFTVTIVGDTTSESVENFNLTASVTTANTPTGYEITSGTGYDVVLRDNENTTFTVDMGPASLTETDANAATSNYTITRTGAELTAETTVTWTVNHGTTVAGDFSAVTGTVTFATGADSGTFALTIVGDTTAEVDKDFTLTASATGSNSGPPYAVTLADNDAATFTVTGGPTSVTETDGIPTFTYTITRTGAALTAATSVTWNIMVGTAADATDDPASPGDFFSDTGTVSFAMGDDTQTFDIGIAGEDNVESAKNFHLVASASGHNSGAGYDVVLNDDDATYTITAGPRRINETDANQNFTYTITRTGADAAAMVTWQVNHATTDGTEAADFAMATGTLNFAMGVLSQDFTLTLAGDNDAEGAENFTLTATAPGHPAGTPYAVTVGDDDTNFAITAGPTSVTETDANADTGAYTITRSGAGAAATITWTIAHGQSGDDSNNPTVAADFGAVTGTVDFAAGDATKTFVVSIAGDTAVEEIENFNIVLSGPSGFGYGAGYDVAITDDDARVFTISGPTSIAETDADASTTFVVNASGADLPAATTTVNWQIMHGTIADSNDDPTSDADFVATTGSVEFEQGDSGVNIGVQVVGDNAVEMTENFHIVLTSTVANFRTSAGYDVAITNDDTHFEITAGPTIIAETDADAASANFTITRTGEELAATLSTLVLTINHGTVADFTDSPTENADFTAVSMAGSFDGGSTTSAVFTITIVGDNAVEATENFNISLSGPSDHSYGPAYDSSITDDDTGFTLSGPTSLTETDADASSTYTITRTGQELTSYTEVGWNRFHGTSSDSGDSPTDGNDLTGVAGSFVAFNAGEDSKTFVITVAGDDNVESTENFHLSFDVLNNDAGHEYGPVLDISITDDDARFTITAGPSSLDETDANAASAAYTITRTGAAVTATVTWTINPGTVADATDNPTEAADFSAVTGTVDFTASDTTRTFTITVVGDNVLDGDENFNLTASAPGHPAGTGYDVALSDDEADFTLTIEPGINTENNFGVAEGADENMRQIRVKYIADDGSSALAAEATATATILGETPSGLNTATTGYPDGLTSERAATATGMGADFAADTFTCAIPANTAHDAVVTCALPVVTDDTLSERVEHFSVELSGGPAGVQYGGKRFHFIAASDPIRMRVDQAAYTADEGDSVTVRVHFSVAPGTTVTVPSGLTQFRILFDDGVDPLSSGTLAANYRLETPGVDTSLLDGTPIWARADGMRHHDFQIGGGDMFSPDDTTAEPHDVQTWQLRGFHNLPISWEITGGDSGDDGTFTVTFVDDDPTSWTVRARGNGVQSQDTNENAPAIATPTTADTAADADHPNTMYFRFTNYESLDTRGETVITYCLAGTATGATAAAIAANPNLVYDYTYPSGYDPTSTSAAHSAYPGTGTCTTGRGSVTIAANTDETYRLGITLNDDNLNEGDETIIAEVVNVTEAGHNTRLERNTTDCTLSSGVCAATRTIKDNDAISVSIANGGTDSDSATGFQVQESQNAVWVVTLSKPSVADASIAWTATGFEAADTSGTDPTSPLTIAAGQTTGEISFALAQDTDTPAADETGEEVSVALDATGHSTGTGGGTIARSSTTSEQSATQEIIQRAIARDLMLTRYTDSTYSTAVDETMAANNVLSAEGTRTSPTRLYFAVGIGSSQTAFSNVTEIYWRVDHAASTGTSDGDFTAVSGSIMHPASTTCTTACRFTVNIVADNLNEDNEIFEIDVSANAFPAGGLNTDDGGTSPDSSAAITITDNDGISLRAVGLTTAVSEGSDAQLNLSLGSVPTTDVTIAYTVGSATATLGTATTGDFRDPGSGSIVFTAAANSATGTVTLPIRADNLNEGPETFTVDFTNAGITGEFGTGTVTSALNPVTFTIGASDPISVSIAADAATALEGGSATFTVTLGGATAGSVADITVPYTLSGVTAVTPTDAGNGSLTIAAGMTSGTITIGIPVDDDATDATADDTLTVTLTPDDSTTTATDEGPTVAAGGGEVARSSTASEQSAQTTVEYLTSLHSVTLTGPVSDPPNTIAETNADANTTYTVAHTSGRAIDAMHDIVITWTVTAAAGQATDADFAGGSLPTGTVTFTSADSADKTFDVGIAGDTLNEASETFTIALSIASANMDAASMNGGVALPAALAVTITDNDPVIVAVTRTSGTGAVDEDSGTLDFSVTLTGGSRGSGVDTIVPFTISGLEDADFNIMAPAGIMNDALGGEVTIASGASTATITVALVNNTVNEAQKTLELQAAAVGASGLRLSGTGTGVVEYSTGGDMVSVDVTDDDDITLSLTSNANLVREGGTAAFTISLTRSDGGAGTVTSVADICVGVGIEVTSQQTPANTAMSGPDIGGLTGCDGMLTTLPVANSLGRGGVIIEAGESSTTLSLSVRFDSVPEGMTNEELEVVIDAIAPGSGAGMVSGIRQVFRVVELVNVDAARSVSVTAGAATVQEGGEMVFSVTATGAAVAEAFDLMWTIGGVDAADVSTGLTGTVSFAASSATTQTQMVRVTAVDDTEAEGDEILTFTLADPCASLTAANCNFGGRPMTDPPFPAASPAIQVSTEAARVTIERNDQPVTLAVTAPAALTEGSAANFTVGFPESITTTGDVTVDWAISFPTASSTVFPAVAADFMAASGSVTIPMGMTSASIAITAVDDAVNEAVESFTVTLSNPAGGGAIAAPVLHATPSADGTVSASDPVTAQLSRTQMGAVVEGGDAEFVVSLVLTADGTTAATSGGAICVEFGTEVANQSTMAANDASSGADIAVSDCDGAAVTVTPATGAATGGGVLIAAGQSSAALSIATRFDSIDEGTTNENLQVTLSGATARAGAGTATHATGAQGMASAEIQNVNSLRTLLVSGPAVGEAGHPDSPANEDGATAAGQTVPVEFAITMNGTVQPDTPVTVRWRLNLESDGSISPPTSGLGRSVEVSDVSSPQTGTVTFGTGETFPIRRMVTVDVQQDALNEGAETLRLVLDAVPDGAGGQPRGPDVPGTRVIQDRAEATVSASDPITVFLTAAADSTVTSGDDARYTLSFGTTTVNGQVVPIVPTTPITVPLTVMVGGTAVTVPDVMVPARSESVPVVITAAQIDAQNRGGGNARIEVTAQAPTGVPSGAMARVAMTADLAEETARRNLLSQAERERLGLVGDAEMAPPARQVAGWTVAVSQPSSDAPEGSDWQAVFTLGGDLAALGSNTIEVPWSLTGRAIGGAEAAVAADFADGPGYTCGANAQGECSTFPTGTVTFSSSAAATMTVAVRVRDDGVAEGDDPQGFSLTVGTIGGTAAAQTVTEGSGSLAAQIPALRANLSVADAMAAEGESAEFVLRLSGFNGGTETTQSITVAYMLTDGPATGGARSGEDFTPPTTPAEVTDCPAERICTVIPAGAEDGTTHRIAVPLLQDGALEPRETFTLTITHALRGGGNIQLVADPGAAAPAAVNQISATGTITDDADQAARRNRRVSTLVTLLDRQAANMATDAISARLSAARMGGADGAQSAQLSLANRNLLGASGLPGAGEDAAGGAQGIGLALYGASGYGAGAAGGSAGGLSGGGSLSSGAASFTGGGASAAFGGLGAGLAGGANLGTRTALPSLAEVLNGSSFSFNAAQGLIGNLAEGVEVWGRAGYADLRGNPQDSGLSYDGDTVAAFLGADTSVTDRLLAGLAIGYASGDLDFTDRVGGFEMKGELSNNTLSVHPYFGWQLSPQANAWLVLGAGTGSLDVEENEGRGATRVSRKLDGGDTAMRMFAAGLSHEQQVGETGDLKLRLAMTRVQSRVDSGRFDDGALLPKTRGRSLRLGVEAEAGRSIALENGVSLRPFGTLRFRLDKSSLAFADEPKVSDQAIDWGAGLEASWAEMGLGGRFAFNRQLNDTGHEEQRVSLDLSYAPGVAGQGIAVSVQTSVEQRAGLGGGMGELFGAGGALRGALTGTGASTGTDSALTGRQQSLSGEIAYGVALRTFVRGASRAALLTPYGRFDLGDADARWAAGLRFAQTRSGLKLGLEARPGLDLLLTGSLPF
ncbi:MAG: hypothetical protein OXU53_03965 [Deltaproteobacteria bacterium]|nr:hypothetical protein [Deltaproteobacteria bacterium]